MLCHIKLSVGWTVASHGRSQGRSRWFESSTAHQLKVCPRTRPSTREDAADPAVGGGAAGPGAATGSLLDALQLRHRFASDGPEEFDESAVSLATGHVSLHWRAWARVWSARDAPSCCLWGKPRFA